jgi:hypothetical protein
MIQATLCFPVVVSTALSRLRARLYGVDAIEDESYDEDGNSKVRINIPQVELLKILGSEGIAEKDLEWSGVIPILSTTEAWETAEQPK